MSIGCCLRLLRQRFRLTQMPHAIVDHVPLDAHVPKCTVCDLGLQRLPLVVPLDDSSIEHSSFQEFPLLDQNVGRGIHFSKTNPVAWFTVNRSPDYRIRLFCLRDIALAEVSRGQNDPGNSLA